MWLLLSTRLRTWLLIAVALPLARTLVHRPPPAHNDAAPARPHHLATPGRRHTHRGQQSAPRPPLTVVCTNASDVASGDQLAAAPLQWRRVVNVAPEPAIPWRAARHCSLSPSRRRRLRYCATGGPDRRMTPGTDSRTEPVALS